MYKNMFDISILVILNFCETLYLMKDILLVFKTFLKPLVYFFIKLSQFTLFRFYNKYIFNVLFKTGVDNLRPAGRTQNFVSIF